MHHAMNATDRDALKQQLPVLIRHEGVWDGIYQYFDVNGVKTGEHGSRLLCRFPHKGRYPYHQTNIYTHADGRSEIRDFPARVEDGRLRWDNALIDGWAADVALDTFGRTSMLYWVRPDEPALYLYEMIHLSDCGQHRARVWQRFRDGELIERTLIKERKVSDDWQAFEPAAAA